jgi:hypothetical protein
MILMRIAVNCPDEMDHVRDGSIFDRMGNRPNVRFTPVATGSQTSLEDRIVPIPEVLLMQ